MIILAAVVLLASLYEPPVSATIERGLPHVESRDNAMAVSPRGATGLWQVMPRSACSRIGTNPARPATKSRLAFCDVAARPMAWLWLNPTLGTIAGRAVFRRYLSRCRGDTRCALRAYACGKAGLRGRCEGYAAAVMAAGGGE
jgi:hypothetical protein